MEWKTRILLFIAFATLIAADYGCAAQELQKVVPKIKRALKQTCSCSGLSCECCVEATFPNSEQKSACISFQYNLNSLTLTIQFVVNGSTIANIQVDPSSFPVCVPFPPIPAVMLCLLANQVHFEKEHAKICTTFQVRAGILVIYHARLPCLELNNGKLSATNNN